MPTTPVYGWPYLDEDTDPLTYGAVSGEDYLLGIEATVSGVDTRLAAVETKATHLNSTWTTYPLTWTSITGSNPTAASHSVTGRWKKVDASLAIVEFRIVGLTSSGWGTGVYGFSLPWNITTSSRDMSAGSGHLLDSGVNEYACNCVPHSVSVLRLYNGSNSVGATSPFTLSTADVIRGSIMVEPA